MLDAVHGALPARPPPPARVRKDQIEAKARELAALQSQLDADTQELDQLKVNRAVSVWGPGGLGGVTG